MKKDNTFIAIGILITIAVLVMALFSFLSEGMSLSDIGLCLFAVAILDALCYLAHRMTNNK